MLDAIYSSVTALQAHQSRLDTVSNNLANVHTPGFKKGRVTFEDLMYRELAPTTSVDFDRPPTLMVGLGTTIARTDRLFSQGDLRQSDRPLDLAIQGSGFFEVELEDETRGYTRLGFLAINESGELVTHDGRRLSTLLRIPADATQVLIAESGDVSARVPREAEPIFLGRLELASFINPNGLRPAGDGIYASTSESGAPFYAPPGEEGMGVIRQGFLEAANVDFVEELVELTLAQRAYQLNARVLQAADQILEEINNLRR